MEQLLVQVVQYVFIGNCCHGEKYVVPHGVETFHVVVLHLDSQQVVEVKMSFACSTELEVVIGRVDNLSSFQESVVPLFVSFALPSVVRNVLRVLVIFESDTSKSDLGLDSLISSIFRIQFHGSIQLSLLENIRWRTLHF